MPGTLDLPEAALGHACDAQEVPLDGAPGQRLWVAQESRTHRAIVGNHASHCPLGGQPQWLPGLPDRLNVSLSGNERHPEPRRVRIVSLSWRQSVIGYVAATAGI